jgi:hypothetical protein
MFMILNANNEIIRLGWIDRDGEVHEDCAWPTLEDAEHALFLVRERACAGALEHREGMRVVQCPDA